MSRKLSCSISALFHNGLSIALTIESTLANTFSLRHSAPEDDISRLLFRFAKCSCQGCSRTSPWGCLLKKLKPKLQEHRQKIREAAEKADSYLEDRPSACVQICSLLFLWLADVLSHPLVDQQSVHGLEKIWPLENAKLPEDIAKCVLSHFSYILRISQRVQVRRIFDWQCVFAHFAFFSLVSTCIAETATQTFQIKCTRARRTASSL